MCFELPVVRNLKLIGFEMSSVEVGAVVKVVWEDQVKIGFVKQWKEAVGMVDSFSLGFQALKGDLVCHAWDSKMDCRP